MLAASFLPLLLIFLPLPACLHPNRRVESSPVSACLVTFGPPRTSVRASSHGDGTSRADISPQRYGPLMSMTSALTCLSFLRALTSSEWDKFPPWGLLTVKYGMRKISAPCCFQIKRGGKEDVGVLHPATPPFPFCLLSKTYSSWLQIFRPFHVVSYLAASSPGIIWQLSERRTTSGLFSSELPLTGEPLLPRTLGFKRRTSDQTRTCAHCSHGPVHFEAAAAAAEAPSLMRKCRQMKAPASSSVEN